MKADVFGAEKRRQIKYVLERAGRDLDRQLGVAAKPNDAPPSCACPEVPAFDELSAAELDRIMGAPLKCTSCGSELELRCPEGHVHQVEPTRSPNHRPAPKPDKSYVAATRDCRQCGQAFAPRKHQRTCDGCATQSPPPTARACQRCGNDYTPARVKQRICATCRDTVPETRSHRTYAPKPCFGCARVFQPTGPRAVYCRRDDCETVAAVRYAETRG